MKKPGAVKKKLKQVKFRLIQKAIRNGISKKPCNCTHSGQVKGNANDPLFYVCLLDSSKPKEWDGVICDPSVPNNCPFFKPCKTEQEIKEEFEIEFDSIINEGDIGKIASKYPDVAALLWVLADDIDNTQDEDND
tara:strand:- start:361 stop:765 length:405 start_codon:yes stop_codon:yes gene_type:complete